MALAPASPASPSGRRSGTPPDDPGAPIPSSLDPRGRSRPSSADRCRRLQADTVARRRTATAVVGRRPDRPDHLGRGRIISGFQHRTNAYINLCCLAGRLPAPSGFEVETADHSGATGDRCDDVQTEQSAALFVARPTASGNSPSRRLHGKTRLVAPSDVIERVTSIAYVSSEILIRYTTFEEYYSNAVLSELPEAVRPGKVFSVGRLRVARGPTPRTAPRSPARARRRAAR